MIRFVALGLIGGMLLALSLGCSDDPLKKQVLRDYKSNLRKVHFCYTTYMVRHGDVGPENKEQLIDYLKTDPTAIHIIKQVGLTPDTVDDIFVSERDGEPFVIRYGVVDREDGGDYPIVFEAKGQDGLRLVAFQDPKECGEQEYNDYLEN